MCGLHTSSVFLYQVPFKTSWELLFLFILKVTWGESIGAVKSSTLIFENVNLQVAFSAISSLFSQRQVRNHVVKLPLGKKPGFKQPELAHTLSQEKQVQNRLSSPDPGAQLLTNGKWKAFWTFPSLYAHHFNLVWVKAVFPGKSWLQSFTRALDKIEQDLGHLFTP